MSPAATVTHVAGSLVYVGSQVGDSQMVRLLSEPNPSGTYVEVAESYANVGPIVDAVLNQHDAAGQVRRIRNGFEHRSSVSFNQMITCSGDSTSGSIRVIRSGAELQTSTIVNAVSDIDQAFPLPLRPGDKSVERITGLKTQLTLLRSHFGLLVSTLTSTTLLDLTRDGLHELPTDASGGLIRNERTLAACTLDTGALFVQVTRSGIYIVSLIDGSLASQWPPGNSTRAYITTATVNSTQVVIALRGGKLLHFSTQRGIIEYIDTRDPQNIDGHPNEVASLSLIHMIQAGAKRSPLVAVGYWFNNSVEILDISTLRPYAINSIIHETHHPRSILLKQFEGTCYLFVGMNNGELVTYTFSTPAGLVNRRTMSLGTELPVSLAICPVEDGGEGDIVIAAGEKGTVIRVDRKTKRLRHSAVAIKV